MTGPKYVTIDLVTFPLDIPGLEASLAGNSCFCILQPESRKIIHQDSRTRARDSPVQ